MSLLPTVSKSQEMVKEVQEVQAWLRESAGNPNYLVDGFEVARQNAQIKCAFPTAYNCSLVRTLVLMLANHDEVEDFLLQSINVQIKADMKSISLDIEYNDGFDHNDITFISDDNNSSDGRSLDDGSSVGSESNSSSVENAKERPSSNAMSSLFSQLRQIEFIRQTSIDSDEEEDISAFLIEAEDSSPVFDENLKNL